MPKRTRRERRREARARRAEIGVVERSVVKARRFADCPVADAFASREIEEAQMGVLAIAREREDGMYAGMSCVVDLGALGVKDVHLVARGPRAKVTAAITAPMQRGQASWSAGQVVRTVRMAAAWREHCGIPQRVEERVALAFCTGLDEDTTHEVTLGAEGRPLLLPGPYDDAEALEALLTARWGRDGYHYVKPL